MDNLIKLLKNYIKHHNIDPLAYIGIYSDGSNEIVGRAYEYIASFDTIEELIEELKK